MIETCLNLSGDYGDALARLEAHVQEHVLQAGAARMARVLRDEAIAQAEKSKDTGTLQASIYRVYAKERSSSVRKLYRISWNRKKAPHGHLVEFGTSKMAAKPFLRPAYDRVGAAIEAGRERMAEVMTQLGSAK